MQVGNARLYTKSRAAGYPPQASQPWPHVPNFSSVVLDRRGPESHQNQPLPMFCHDFPSNGSSFRQGSKPWDEGESCEPPVNIQPGLFEHSCSLSPALFHCKNALCPGTAGNRDGSWDGRAHGSPAKQSQQLSSDPSQIGFQVRLVFGIGFYQGSMGKPGLWSLWSVGIV